MDGLRQLYQEIILDHNQNPRNCCTMADADETSEGFNPLCGDKLTVFLKFSDDTIKDISFVGEGCAISTASASLMTDALRGMPREEAKALFKRVHAMLTGEQVDTAKLGKLSVLAGVNEFPARVKCASLAWHTLQSALTGSEQVATTE